MSRAIGSLEVTLVARLTPAVPSAIATIAVHGAAATEIVSRLVTMKQVTADPFPLGRVRYGLWNAVNEHDAVEQVVVCRTGECNVEIHCHGGNAVCQMIMHDLIFKGCTRVEAVEFPGEALSEFAREAAIDLQRAATDRAAAVLLDQMNGALGDAIAQISDRWQREGSVAVREAVQALLNRGHLGLHLAEPWQVVLTGPPNVGKSSLLNAIAGSQRAIVHSEPGTTRDWIEVLTAIEGWPVSLSDTAGLRESTDPIESEGIRRAMERVSAADLVVYVVDATVGWTDAHEQLKAAARSKPSLVVWNKSDLWNGDASLIPREGICTSTRTEQGIDELLTAIAAALVPDVPPANAAVPFRERHLQLLRGFL